MELRKIIEQHTILDMAFNPSPTPTPTPSPTPTPATTPALRPTPRERGRARGDSGGRGDGGRGQGRDRVRDDDGQPDERHLHCHIKGAFVLVIMETLTVAQLVTANADLCPFHSNATHFFLQCYTMKNVANTLGVQDNFTAACRECNVMHDGGRGNWNRNNETPRSAAGDNISSNNTNNTPPAYSNPLQTNIEFTNTPVPTPSSPTPQLIPSIRGISEQNATPSSQHPPIPVTRCDPMALQMVCTTADFLSGLPHVFLCPFNIFVKLLTFTCWSTNDPESF